MYWMKKIFKLFLLDFLKRNPITASNRSWIWTYIVSAKHFFNVFYVLPTLEPKIRNEKWNETFIDDKKKPDILSGFFVLGV